MNELHLFAGAGGGILGGMLLGHTCVCAVEIEPYPREQLLQRQRDGILPPFLVYDDVCTFDGTPWRGRVDIVCGGFPCQDISAAGKGAGIEGEKSGLWKEFARIIGEVRPAYVFVENSPMLTLRGLGRVLGDLATLGFDARHGVLGACDAGAPHKRDRMWILAKSRYGGGGTSGVLKQGRDHRANGQPVQVRLVDQVNNPRLQPKDETRIPTPMASDHEAREGHRGKPDTLTSFTRMWPTPQANKTTQSGELINADGSPWDGEQKPHSRTTGNPVTTALADKVAFAERERERERETGPLAHACELGSETGHAGPQPRQERIADQPDHGGRFMWPTPLGRDWKGSVKEGSLVRKDGKSRMDTLPNVVRWASPTASDGTGGPGQSDKRTGGDNLRTQVAMITEDECTQLNPDWVELLMGWPMGWTSAAPMTAEEFEAWIDGFTAGERPSRYGHLAWQDGSWESGVPRVSRGVPSRTDRLKAIGNGQVPACAALAFATLLAAFEQNP